MSVITLKTDIHQRGLHVRLVPVAEVGIGGYQLSELEGVRFLMTEDGKTSIPCRVSYEALQDLARHQRFEGPLSDLFETYRPLIERVASDTYHSNGLRDAEGLILVTSEVLTRPVKA